MITSIIVTGADGEKFAVAGKGHGLVTCPRDLPHTGSMPWPRTTHARLKFAQLLLILAQRASSFSSTNFRMWYNASSGRDDMDVCAARRSSVFAHGARAGVSESLSTRCRIYSGCA